uniref:uS13m n=1 Tax=Polytomella magna TaxID=353565 RepID=UPI002240E4AB|nr:Chain Bm, uS13m [Polytomella magna]8APN_Bm Chain Bm, uS13m [Polytomella magna]8APO_Bm Chain Bm, uS13m [Polytomella magna]
VQIQRVTLPPHQCVYMALKKVFGLGGPTSLAVVEACGISKGVRVRDLKENHVQQITQFIQDNFVTEDNLRRKVREDIVKLVNIKSRDGLRHDWGVSIKGHTSCNGKTAKRLRH